MLPRVVADGVPAPLDDAVEEEDDDPVVDELPGAAAHSVAVCRSNSARQSSFSTLGMKEE